MSAAASRIQQVMQRLEPAMRFFTESRYARRPLDRPISDFTTGSPHDMPLTGFVRALARASIPHAADWYGYKISEPGPRAVVAASLQASHELPFEAEDIFLTNGAFAAIAVVLGALIDPGDEVIFISPPWFFYEALIAASGARPVRVPADPRSFGLNVDAVAAALTPRTRAVIINSPNNPTGVIYPPATLADLSLLLAEASDRRGRPIYLISDEAYSRILFDDNEFVSPVAFYPRSFLIYTYAKTLLTPGQRLGYIALPPAMPERRELREALLASQIVSGYAFPNALLQHALPDLEQLSINIGRLQERRDRLVKELRAIGYRVHIPEATFYLLPHSPISDDQRFVDLLAEDDVYCLPGAVIGLPGFFRISLTASDAMISRALPVFEQAWERTHQQARRVGAW
jgi:aspartate aminotransferase